MRKNTVIGFALVVLLASLAGASRADAEPVARSARGAKAQATASAANSAPAAAPARTEATSPLRRLIDSFFHPSISPAVTTPAPKVPLGMSSDDFDVPSCDEVPDPTVPCRVKSPIYG